MGQWYRWLCRTKAETKLPSLLGGMFPGGHPWHVNILMKNIRWGFEFHGCYRHQVSMISVIYWWILIRSGEKLQISTYLDSEIFADVRDLPWISRISTAREEKHRHGESHDCTGPWPPRPVWNSVVKPGFNQHFPHEFVWTITIKTCKNPNLMVNHVFPPIDCYSEGISYFQTAEWLTI